MTTEMIEAPVTEEKKTRKGNPLMRAVTDADVANNREFIYQKFDSLFKQVEDESLFNAALWKGYLDWRKDSDKREKFAKAAKLKQQVAEMGLTPEEIFEMLKSK